MISLIRRIKRVDLLIILVFILFASFYSFNRSISHSTVLWENSDAGNVAGFLAAKENPQLFRGDALLSDPSNYGVYLNAHNFLIYIVQRLSHSVLFTILSLLWLQLFFHMFGFFLLGLALFKNRFWAIILSIITLFYVAAGFDLWGIYYEPLSRISFDAAWPYILAGLIYWKNRPFVWPWLLGAAGLLVFLHPLSTIVCGFSLWLGLWVMLPGNWRLVTRFGYMIFMGLILSLPVLFVMFWLQSGAGNAGSVQYELVIEALEFRLPLYMNPASIIGSLLYHKVFLYVFWSGFISFLYLFFIAKDRSKELIMIVVWIIGIILMSVVLPACILAASYKFKFVPMGLSLFRGVKFLVPLMYLPCLWLFARYFTKIDNKQTKLKAGIVVFLILTFLTYRQLGNYFTRLNHLWGKVVLRVEDQEETSRSQAVINVLEMIKQKTPSGTKFLSLAETFPDLPIRYYALRPLVVSLKDGASFYYSNHQAMVNWHSQTKKITQTMEKIAATQSSRKKYYLYQSLAKELGAEYFVLDRGQVGDQTIFALGSILFYNDYYLVVKVK